MTTARPTDRRKLTVTTHSQEFPRTEAGVIPVQWCDLRIRDICTLINGRGFKPHEWRDSGLPIIRIQNLNGSPEFNYYDGAFNPKILVENGQLLFAWSGSRGTSFGPHIWHGSKGVLNYHTWKVLPNPRNVDVRFLFHALRHLTAYIEDKAHGASALVHAQKWEMEGLHVAVPPIAEQRAIATALSDVDELIGALDKLIAKKRAIKLATMQQLLTGKTRLPGFEGEWEMKSIGEFAPLQRGFDLPTSRLVPGPYPVVYSNGLMAFHEKSRVKGPGVVTGRSGTIGKVHYIDMDYWPHNTSLWVTTFNRSQPRFVYYLYTHINFSRFLSGSGVPTLNRNDVHSQTVACPSPEEQNAIATVLSDMDAEIAALEQRRDKTKAIKQGMMQSLLTGRVRLVTP